MSKSSQPLPDVHPGENEDASRPLLIKNEDILEPVLFPWHSHRRAQLGFAATGLMSISTKRGTWIVPPEQAFWIPAGVEHQVETKGPLSIRFLYLHPDVVLELPSETRVLRVTPLLRALILRLASYPAWYAPDSPAARLAAVIPDELRWLEPEPLYLPLPRDRRVASVTDALLADPAEPRGLGAWARDAGASERTLARLFLKETGMTFGAWRQRRRLTAAVQRLAEGANVTSIALDLGYDSTSAFIAMFKKELGTTPGRYIAGA
jgi:AraC-like DNA-binding protein